MGARPRKKSSKLEKFHRQKNETNKEAKKEWK